MGIYLGDPGVEEPSEVWRRSEERSVRDPEVEFLEPL